jgi:hypothetical protein
MSDQTSSRFDRAAGPVYFLAFLFLALPLMDFVMNVWPLQIDKVNWRYGAFGLAGGFLLTPLLGLVMLMVASILFGSRRVLSITAVLSSIVALGLILLSMAFILDSVQMRSGVPESQKRIFDAGVLKALVKDITGAICAAWVAFGSFRSLSGVLAPSKRADGSPLVIGARAEKASS